MTFHTIIDDNSSSKIQFRQLLVLGLNYSFNHGVSSQSKKRNIFTKK